MSRRGYKSWPFKEADRIVRAAGRAGPPEVAVLETGYGPSGLPHIGTFAEVARTTWVARAYRELTGRATRLVAFSDDLDGLRKVPDNLPNGEMLAEHLGKPLSDIPDPYGCCESFSAHMIGTLAAFLEEFGFECEMRASSDAYREGDFDEGLGILLERVDGVLEIILPTLGEEKRERWSPFLPKCERCGRIYTTRVTRYLPGDLAVEYACDGAFGDVSGCGHRGVASVLRGGVKAGWKVDWALRWYCYGIHYEMYGKDLIPSADLSARIVRLMGGRPPAGFPYEMFLDERGEKISKSRGNGVAMEEWLAYAPVESLAYFVFRDPRQAKKLSFDVIPKAMDDYLDHLRRYPDVPDDRKPDAPAWHIHGGGGVPGYTSSVSFALVGNLISALGSGDRALIVEFLGRYDPRIADHPEIVGALVDKGIRYYEDHVLPGKRYRPPTENERPLFEDLAARLAGPEVAGMSEKDLQGIVFDVARERGVEPKDFFGAIYRVLLGQDRGPRFGTFAKLLGPERVIDLVREKAG